MLNQRGGGEGSPSGPMRAFNQEVARRGGSFWTNENTQSKGVVGISQQCSVAGLLKRISNGFGQIFSQKKQPSNYVLSSLNLLLVGYQLPC